MENIKHSFDRDSETEGSWGDTSTSSTVSLDQLYEEHAFCHGDCQSHVDISMANIMSNKNTSVRLR